MWFEMWFLNNNTVMVVFFGIYCWMTDVGKAETSELLDAENMRSILSGCFSTLVQKLFQQFENLERTAAHCPFIYLNFSRNTTFQTFIR